MKVPIRLPQFGDMVDGRIIRWLKQESDAVTEGDPIVEVETAKANTEVEAPATGVLSEIIARAELTVVVGDILGFVTTA
jgi:2-oxoglutarate dehydrogenase E2 component (dihydrolipoamide succinyltransferase)